MIDFETQSVFPTHAVGLAGPLPPGAERLTLAVADDQKLHGVHIAPPRRTAAPRTLILGFGGNAWNGQDVAAYLHEIFPDADVVAFHYRGYRPSTGSPSAEALLADAPLVHDCAVERVKPKRTVAVGFSIGTGVAAAIAATRDLDGLILVTPFDSLTAVASDWFPMLGGFLRHEMDSGRALATSHVPTAIIAAELDGIIPRARTDGLRRRAANLVFDRTIGGAGHNDIYARSDFHQAMRDALAAVIG
ncbi:MAG: alpha/beta fold hydrolase [Sphingomicrobium sp.]